MEELAREYFSTQLHRESPTSLPFRESATIFQPGVEILFVWFLVRCFEKGR